MEPAPHQALAEDEDDGEDDDRLQQRDAEQHGELFRRSRQRGQDDEQRHHGEVLEEQDADDFTAVCRIELQALGQQLGEHRGRRHREDGAERQCDLPVGPEDHGQRRDDRDAEHDLEQPEPEHDALHCVQPRQRELEADREHQEDDPELGEVLHP